MIYIKRKHKRICIKGVKARLRRRFLDRYFFISLFLVFLVILVVVYPLVSFYIDVYFGMDKGLVYDAKVTYAFIFEVSPERAKQFLAKYGTDRYAVLIELRNPDLGSNTINVSYKLIAIKNALSFRSIEDGGVVFYNSSVIAEHEEVKPLDDFLLKLLMPPRDRLYNDGIALSLKKAGFYIAYPEPHPDRVLGVPRTYQGSLSLETPSIECSYPSCNLLYIGLDDTRLLLLELNIRLRDTDGDSSSFITYLGDVILGRIMDSKALEDDLTGEMINRSEEVILRLDSISGFIPSDQAWLEYLWWNFNRLFPFSYAVIMASIILLIVRVRRWL